MSWPTNPALSDDMRDAHQVDEAEAEEHGDDTHDETHARHILLLYVACGIGQGVRWCRDGQDHGR